MIRWRRSARVACRQIDEEAVLVPIRTSVDEPMQVHALNAVGLFIWERLDGEHDTPALADAVVEAFEVGHARALADVESFLKTLADAELIERVEHTRATTEDGAR